MKKLALLILTILLFVNLIPAHAIEANPMENELFEIIAEVKDVKSLRSFKNSLAAYYLEDGRIGGYVDYTGSKVMMPVYDSSADFYLSPDGEFNDGVKIGLNANEQWVYMDVNTNEIMPYPLDGYGDYNFGYFSTIKSNITDEGIIFETIFTNIADDAVFTFKNAYIPTFDNNGYSIMNLNDDSGRPCGCYIIRLKRVIIPTVQLNGIKIAFDQIPNIENGRTLVPLRGIFEALGAEVEWNGATQTVTATKGDTVITLTINSTTATKNNQPITLDVPARIVNGRTLVPVRFIADCFGVGVAWDGVNKIVGLSN